MTDSTFRVSRDLLRKYDRVGPRYTSYPTVPEWSAEFGPDDYRRALEKAAGKDSPLSLYFHLPFCRKRCYYCGCTTVVSSQADRADTYIDILQKEMEQVASHLGKRNEVIQLHWGGGTPTFLYNRQIEKLFSLIGDHFRINSEAEMAIEVDPRVTTREQLTLLRQLGFNRVSMGVQDLTPEVQEAIGRNQTAEETEELIDHCRALNYDGINVDLIYGLPRQTVNNFARTISEVIRMGADRVAVYSFAFLPSVKSHQKLIDVQTLPSTDTKYELFATAVEKFVEAGYVQIGMDHFARPEDELARSLAEGRLYRNFMGYTTRKASDSVGFGMSSISELAGCFSQNISKLEEYSDVIGNSDLAAFRGCRLSDDDKIRQQAILSLMCNFKLSFDDLDSKFGIDSRKYFSLELGEMKQFIDDGLAVMDKDAISVLPPGRILVRNIAMVFDAYLRNKGKEGSTTFSRTI